MAAPPKPIYNNNPLFGTTLAKTNCPRLRDICGSIPDSRGNAIWEGSQAKPPPCNDTSNFIFTENPDESPYGCCLVESSNNTCADSVVGISVEERSKYYTGIYVADLSGNNKRKICHSAPIRKRTIDVSEFFKSLVISAAAILGVAIIGACHEFWLKYGLGNHTDAGCYTFTSTFTRDAEELSPIDYLFPVNANKRPYKKNKDGDNFAWPYDMYSSLCLSPFPDPLAVFNNTTRIEIMFIGVKRAYYLIMVRTIIEARDIINVKLLTPLAQNYKKITEEYYRNFVFFVLTGILFHFIAEMTKEQKYYIGFCSIIFLLLCVSVWAVFLAIWRAGSEIVSGHLFPNLFHNISRSDAAWSPRKAFLHYWLEQPCIYCLALVLWLVGVIGAIFFGGLGALLGLCWTICELISMVYVYVPIFAGKCLCKIIQSHSELLIILFCLSIVLSSYKHLNSTTTIIIALLVGIIVLYKMYTVFNSKPK